MYTYAQAFYELKNKLHGLYDDREAAAIAHEALKHITGLSKTQRLISKETVLNGQQATSYESMCARLLAGEPLQYATGSAWFMGREYNVNNAVLIPRPETEELTAWIIEDNRANSTGTTVLDIGTGSGCIAITLKLELKNAAVSSCDISAGAIAVAKGNAHRHNAEIHFAALDFLDEHEWGNLGKYDVIVSNPPYIPVTEKENMHRNVKDHEPEAALFVPADDQLLFYRAIAHFGKGHLAEKGYIYCELEASHAQQTQAMFAAMDYNAQIKKDMHGNWRMLKARL